MAGMGWRTTEDVAEFLARAGAYLRRERARNTVLLTVAEQLRVNPARCAAPEAGGAGPAHHPLFGWWTGQDGEAGGAFLPTPPFPLLLTAVPADVAAGLAAALRTGSCSHFPRLALPAGNLAFPGRGGILSSLC